MQYDCNDYNFNPDIHDQFSANLYHFTKKYDFMEIGKLIAIDF